MKHYLPFRKIFILFQISSENFIKFFQKFKFYQIFSRISLQFFQNFLKFCLRFLPITTNEILGFFLLLKNVFFFKLYGIFAEIWVFVVGGQRVRSLKVQGPVRRRELPQISLIFFFFNIY